MNAVVELMRAWPRAAAAGRTRGAMDSKEVWIHKALGLMSKCRGENPGDQRGLVILARITECAEVIG